MVSTSKVARNATWIIVSKIIQSVLALVINLLTARFLGPANFGIINYASSIVAFAVPIMNLGFSNVLVQELTNHPEEEGKILGTSILLSLISSIFCIFGVLSYTLLVDYGETITNWVVGLFSLMLIAQAFELIQYWFQTKLISKYTAVVSLAAYLVVASYKVFLLISKAEVTLFAISNSIDYLIIAIFLFIIYKRKGGQHISFSSEIGKRMFKKSKHYIISNLMITIFIQTDRVMLKLMVDEASVGYYSAAVTCASMTSFVFAAIIDSFRLLIFDRKKENNEIEYELNLKRLYCIVIYLSLAQSIAMTLLSPYIIYILYGEQYNLSIIALQIVVWYTTFSYVGSVRNIWILGENKQKYLLIINASGAILNIILNFILIKRWGLYGAAFASLITQLFSNVIINFIVWPLKHNNFLMLKSLNPNLIIQMFVRREKNNDIK